MAQLRLLFIEDDPNSIEPAMNRLEKSYTCDVRAFSEVEGALDSFMPDMVILDVLEGSSSSRADAGLWSYDLIWNRRFCPIIVYSALPEALTDNRPPHPFVKAVKKGRDLEQLEGAITELTPHAQALNGAEKHILREFARAVRDIAPRAFELVSNPTERDELILRSGRRRLAARMDIFSSAEQKLASWEHYLCPPVSPDIRLGDLLRQTNELPEEPRAFRLVLSPSCDLVASGGRRPKLSSVLVARCCSFKDGLDTTSYAGIKVSNLEGKLNSILSQGFFETIIPFPALVRTIPSMVANLRDLELIPLADIDEEKKPEITFIRVASIDSPFRELVSWAHMQVACRPGLPDRDFDKWSEETIALYKEDTKNAKTKGHEGI